MSDTPIWQSDTAYTSKLYRIDCEGIGTLGDDGKFDLTAATKGAQFEANKVATAKGYKVTGSYTCPANDGQKPYFSFDQTVITVEGIPKTPPTNVPPTTVTTDSQINDAAGLAKATAEEKAANTNKAETVTVNGATVTAQPPPRPSDISQKASGNPPADVPIEGRQIARNVTNAIKQRNNANTNDDEVDQGQNSPGNPKYNVQQLYGASRNRTAQIPGMEALMRDVPNGALGKTLSLLPPVFSSLMPLGSILGVASKLPLPLNSIATLVGGAALGSVAGQVLRSAGGVGAVGGISGMLGAVGATSALNQAGGSIMNPSTASQLGSVLGTVARIGLVKSVTTGIPLSSAVLGVATGVALKTFANSLSIPTSILGTSGSSGLSAITNILGATVSGRIPILPTNLSLPGITGLSGLAQNISPGLADNLIPRSQLQGLLPGNLQNQIQTAVPPRVTTGGVPNDVETRGKEAPEQSPGPVPTGTKPDEKQPLLTGRVNGRIPYEQRASDGGITLGQMSASATPWKHNIVSQNGLTVDQIIYNLSWIAQNILDPLKAAFPGMIITCGFRGPDGTNPQGDHGRGAACDISWGNGQYRKHFQIAQWIRQNNIPVKQLILEGTARSDWIHVAGGPYTARADYGDARDMTTWTGGSPYTHRLVARP